MTFLVLSDSHGRSENIKEAFLRCGNPDAVLFLGDGVRDVDAAALSCRVVSVRGNCDVFSSFSGELPAEHFEAFGEYNIMLTHGHLFGVKESLSRAASYAASRGADLLLFGHTHRRADIYLPAGEEIGGIILRKPLRLFNPGSISLPTGSGRSFGVITIRGRDILLSHGEL